jgi:hypothetical protein
MRKIAIFRTRLQHIVAFVSLFFVVWTFYVPLLNSYFASDDTQWIWFSASKSVYKILFSPEDYRAISVSNFTPLLGLSFKVDWNLFGMNPEGYNIHNFLSLLAAGGVLYMFMRLFFSSFIALLGLILFFLNPVVLSAFSWSSTRHYIEGMICGLISLTLYVKAYREAKVSVMSGLFYLLSVLYKEVYIVLPFVAFVISKGAQTRRIRSIAPMFLGILLYVPWRLWILGGIGGYPFIDGFSPKIILYGISKLITIMPVHFFGSYSFMFWIVVAVLAAIGAQKAAVRFGAVAASLFVPVLPVLCLFDKGYSMARFIFLPSVYFVFVCILCITENQDRKKWRLITAGVCVILAASLFVLRDKELRTTIEKERQATKRSAEEFISSGKKYVMAEQPEWFYVGLRDIWEYFYGKKIYTNSVPDNAYLLRYSSWERREDLQLNGFYRNGSAGKDLRSRVIKERFILTMNGYRLHWHLEPSDGGAYSVVYGKSSELYHYKIPIKDSGTLMFGKRYPDRRPDTSYLKFVYQSPDGWEGVGREYRIEIPSATSLVLTGDTLTELR